MLIYEVNLTVESDAANAYSVWLKEHIRATLELDGFEAAAWYVRDPDAEPGRRRSPDDGPLGDRHWTIHYHLASRTHLERYLDEHAERMRAGGAQHFEGRFTADRRVLEKKQVFSHVAEEKEE